MDPRFSKRGLKNVFRTEIDGTGFGWYNIEFIAKHLAPRFNLKPNQIKIAFLSEDSSYGQGVTEAARERAKKDFGMQEVAMEYYAFASTNDFSPIVAKLKQVNPDVVHHIARGNDAVALLAPVARAELHVQGPRARGRHRLRLPRLRQGPGRRGQRAVRARRAQHRARAWRPSAPRPRSSSGTSPRR